MPLDNKGSPGLPLDTRLTYDPGKAYTTTLSYTQLGPVMCMTCHVTHHNYVNQARFRKQGCFAFARGDIPACWETLPLHPWLHRRDTRSARGQSFPHGRAEGHVDSSHGSPHVFPSLRPAIRYLDPCQIYIRGPCVCAQSFTPFAPIPWHHLPISCKMPAS